MIKRYCAGTFQNGIEDFYYDTKFASIDEVVEFATNRDLDVIYDSIADEFMYLSMITKEV